MQRETIVEALGEFIQDRQGDYAHKDICASVGELGEAALTALEALGLAVVPREQLEALANALANNGMMATAEGVAEMLAAAPLPAAPNEGEV
jgi:hypothetical protein